MMSSILLEQVVRAKKRGVPFLAIATPDSKRCAADITQILSVERLEGQPELTAVNWDIARGIYSVSSNFVGDSKGEQWLKSLAASGNATENNEFSDLAPPPRPPGEGNLTEALEVVIKLPKNSILFVFQANRWLDGKSPNSIAAIQAACNLRNPFKNTLRMVVFLSNNIDLPIELRTDTIVLDDPLPTVDDLESLISSHNVLAEATSEKDERRRAASFVTGLSLFGAEQALYLSAKVRNKKPYLDMDELRALRHKTVEQTKGLHIDHTQFTFDDVAGVPYIKSLLERIMKGKEPPNLIVNVEEIEKAMAGVKGDNTGVSQDQLGTLLDHMEVNGDEGVIFFGTPGSSKSYVAQTVGKTFGVDTVRFDLNGMKQSEVGSSEVNIREALKVVNAISGGRKLWIGTCNGIMNLDAALLRRFNYGVIYFDLPSIEERNQVWNVQKKLWHISAAQNKGFDKIDHSNWSAAEIRNCCKSAYKFGITLLAASEDITPVAVQNPRLVAGMRVQAHNKLRSASTGKPFVFGEIESAKKTYHDDLNNLGNERQVTM